MGACGLALGAYTVRDLLEESGRAGLRVGFPNDAPAALGKWSREADWYEAKGGQVRCVLCPHECVLRENDRGFCRTRVVRDGKLFTVAYGNPCAVHLDPIEKKPFCHFLPGTQAFSLAAAGCNLRCLNCQNWEISQSKPEQTENADLMPADVVAAATARGCTSIAYTYSEPLVFYEYVRDTAEKARERGLRNVLVSAGYVCERPLRALCRVLDAATVDLKGFSDDVYRRLTGSTLAPVLRSLEVLREEKVWLEVSRLIVPDHSDDLADVRAMCRWLVRTLGADVPLHFLRFHPAYRLTGLPPTPVETVARARDIALEEGVRFVYEGNVPGRLSQSTRCPQCGRTLIERDGFRVRRIALENGRCACGTSIPGVWP